MARYAFMFLTAVLAAFTSGCVSQQHSEFRGVILQGPATAGTPHTNTVQEIGAEFANRDDSLPDAVCGYHFGQSLIFFVYDRKKYVDNDYCLSNDMHPAVYFANWSMRGTPFWQKFLAEDVATREKSEGLRRLRGKCDIEKWKDNIHFRVRLDMKSPGPDPVKVDGILTTYDKWQFNPVLAIGVILGSAGIAGE
jgi:hypothetical protein